ncbi:tropinone reductase homolog At5g06060 isoform X1 [Triticum aestivum]|uniref:tropinone reductase homolog At5g06060 isoform X1 n=1 Tax=Triticum aestivum TaxID=4565 RepID=UPI001D0087DB|nr:tropinone reductase homolog At5g06060-like isoform X1 [Triticum aestivum]
MGQRSNNFELSCLPEISRVRRFRLRSRPPSKDCKLALKFHPIQRGSYGFTGLTTPTVYMQVNNAAQALAKAVVECTPEEYTNLMATNLESCFHLSQLTHPLLLRDSIAGGGSIVNLSSLGGTLGFPCYTLYGIKEEGINQLTRNLATEWAQNKIRVNCVAPGVTKSDMLNSVGTD